MNPKHAEYALSVIPVRSSTQKHKKEKMVLVSLIGFVISEAIDSFTARHRQIHMWLSTVLS